MLLTRSLLPPVVSRLTPPPPKIILTPSQKTASLDRASSLLYRFVLFVCIAMYFLPVGLRVAIDNGYYSPPAGERWQKRRSAAYCALSTRRCRFLVANIVLTP